MKLRNSRILLMIFGLSVSFAQLIELGHEALHTFKNPIHYHNARKYKDFRDHSLKDHHFPKMKFAHEMDEPRQPSNFIALAYFFFQPLDHFDLSHFAVTNAFHTRVVEHDYFVYHSPPTPPPLAV